MTERRAVGPRQTVVLQPGQSVVIEAASIATALTPSETAKRKRIEAFSRARGYFQENTEDIARLMGGEVEDRDRIQLDSGVELRELTLGLMEVGITADQVVRDVQRSLLGRPGMIDPIYASDTARSFGRLLIEEEDRILEERIAQDAASSKLTPKPRLRS